MKKFLILLFFTFLQCSAYAQEEKTIKIPIVFPQKGLETITSACLRIKEKTYEIDWESFKNVTQESIEKTLVETITAMQKKDSFRLKELSHPQLRNNPQEFEYQSSAFFDQLSVYQIGKVKSYLRFDNLIVFFIEFKYNEKSFIATLLFMFDEREQRYGFMTNAKNLNWALVQTWYISDWGLAKNKSPSYCDDSLKFSHRVMLEDKSHSDSSAELLLIGNSLADNDNQNAFSSELLNQFAKMQQALASGRMDEYFDGFTEHASQKNRDWFLKEGSDLLRKQYVKNFVNEKPFYIFDANPVFVMYAYGKGVISLGDFPFRVSYFVRGSDGKFKLAEEGSGWSSFEGTFQSKKFLEAASEEKPFDSWKIK